MADTLGKLIDDAITLLVEVGTWPNSVVQPPLPWMAGRDSWIARAQKMSEEGFDPAPTPINPVSPQPIMDAVLKMMKAGERVEIILEDGQLTVKVLR